VTGDDNVGGLLGKNDNTGTVGSSYSTSNVTGNLHVGGLVGRNQGSVSNSFWDTQTSGWGSSAGGTGKTTAQMMDIDTFTGVGWDILAVGGSGDRNTGYVWNIVDDVTYAFLSWQPV
jgi:The GLUG motif